MSNITKASIKKLYVQAIIQYQHQENEQSVRRDVRTTSKGSGNWCPGALLEIYCENGIRNASDIESFEWDGKHYTHYNSETWNSMDDYVNLMLEATGTHRRVYHEPYNDAVVGIYWA